MIVCFVACSQNMANCWVFFDIHEVRECVKAVSCPSRSSVVKKKQQQVPSGEGQETKKTYIKLSCPVWLLAVILVSQAPLLVLL